MLVSLVGAAHALEPCGEPKDFIFDSSFGPGPTIAASDEAVLTLVDPIDLVPDEHSSFLLPATATDPFLFFEAGRNGTTGALVLQTDSNLQSFGLATGYSSPVLGSPKLFDECATTGDPAGLDGEWDENYAAPGSVLQDPTLGAGNLIMVYEGENHCRSDSVGVVHNVQPYYATAGFARSSDNGMTWPAPQVATTGPLRLPILGGPDSKPPYDGGTPMAVGDAIPSAYIKGSCLYVVYANHPGPAATSKAIAIQIARAQLDGTTNPPTFNKYLVTDGIGAFDSDGLSGAGTNVIPFTPIGAPFATPTCTGTQFQPGLSFNDALRRYVMTMVCEVSSISGELAWFYSTATSLDMQDWTPPQIIENTQATTSACLDNANGIDFDGWYPSLYNVNLPAGHTGKNNIAFYMDGCNLSKSRSFNSRSVTVTPDPG